VVDVSLLDDDRMERVAAGSVASGSHDTSRPRPKAVRRRRGTGAHRDREVLRRRRAGGMDIQVTQSRRPFGANHLLQTGRTDEGRVEISEQRGLRKIPVVTAGINLTGTGD